MVSVITPSPSNLTLLNRFSQAGGVLDFVFMAGIENSESDAVLHLTAAGTAVEVVNRRHNEKTLSYFKPFGSRISIDEFLGPHYSNKNGFWRNPKGPFFHDEMWGFAFAFMQPPYGLHNSPALFLEFKKQLFDDFPGDAAIWKWNTDGLTHFDDGREWWGTFFWTYQATPSSPIIAVLGSTTD